MTSDAPSGTVRSETSNAGGGSFCCDSVSQDSRCLFADAVNTDIARFTLNPLCAVPSRANEFTVWHRLTSRIGTVPWKRRASLPLTASGRSGSRRFRARSRENSSALQPRRYSRCYNPHSFGRFLPQRQTSATILLCVFYHPQTSRRRSLFCRR